MRKLSPQQQVQADREEIPVALQFQVREEKEEAPAEAMCQILREEAEKLDRW